MDTTSTPSTPAPTAGAPRRRRPRRLARLLASVGLATIVAAGMAACDPHTPADCTKDCIDSVFATNAGHQLWMVGKGGAIIPSATIYSDAAMTKPVGYVRNHNLHQYHTMDIWAKDHFVPPTNPAKVQLAPNATYYYRAQASGAGSKVWTETGSFKTMNRFVTFTIDGIWLYDDSDLSGAGEITVEARVNSGTASQVYKNLNWASEAPTVNPKFSKLYSGVGPKVTLQVRAWDDDCSFSSCKAPASAWQPVGGNGDTQWSTMTYVLDAPTQGATGTWKGVAKGDGIGTIGFHINGTWQVTYGWGTTP